jgi:ABC-type antimicrobial peptide transport system permease subunit
VNKAALDLMQLEDPIGTQLDFWGSKRTLVGVVDDVLMGSATQKVGPMMIVFIPDWISAVTVRLERNKDLNESLATVERVFNKYNPAYPFEYTFVDVEFAKKFRMITLISTLATIFAVLAIVITCLGLFGLASFTAEQRTKELGIRKVMGASVASLVILVSNDFSKLVLLAFSIAAPISWFAVNWFMQRFPVRIDFPWWVLPVSGFIALAFTLFIVGAQAIKAATANPVNSLRNE